VIPFFKAQMIKRYSTISIKIKRSKDIALIGLKKIKRMKRYSNISFKVKRSKETINIKWVRLRLDPYFYTYLVLFLMNITILSVLKNRLPLVYFQL
jgi:hypothetical protein